MRLDHRWNIIIKLLLQEYLNQKQKELEYTQGMIRLIMILIQEYLYLLLIDGQGNIKKNWT